MLAKLKRKYNIKRKSINIYIIRPSSGRLTKHFKLYLLGKYRILDVIIGHSLDSIPMDRPNIEIRTIIKAEDNLNYLIENVGEYHNLAPK